MSNKVTVKIEINGIVYPISCISGEEERLLKSSEEVNNVIRGLSNVSGIVGETRLLVMTSLLLADKLIDNNTLGKKDINAIEMKDLIDWLSKATDRMNTVAKLLENK